MCEPVCVWKSFGCCRAVMTEVNAHGNAACCIEPNSAQSVAHSQMWRTYVTHRAAHECSLASHVHLARASTALQHGRRPAFPADTGGYQRHTDVHQVVTPAQTRTHTPAAGKGHPSNYALHRAGSAQHYQNSAACALNAHTATAQPRTRQGHTTSSKM